MSTVSAPGPSRGPAIEPTRVFAPSGEDSWEDDLDLFRQGGVRLVDTTPYQGADDNTQQLPRGTADPDTAVDVAEAGTDPAADAPPSRSARVRLPLIVSGAVAAGFALAFLLLPQTSPFRVTVEAAPTAAPAAPAASASPTALPDGLPVTTPPEAAGVLRQGDAGSEVLDLQTRLLRIPDVYTGGKTDGQYDGTLAEAVARFQLWYGISGDETGEYGDDTRRDLESRTQS